MSAFMGKKVSAIAVMNSIINCGLVPAVYKGKTVVPGIKKAKKPKIQSGNFPIVSCE